MERQRERPQAIEVPDVAVAELPATRGVVDLLQPVDLVRVKRAFTWMQVRQFGLIVLFFGGAVGLQQAAELLRGLDVSPWWLAPLALAGVLTGDWLSRRNHACPACRHILPTMRSIQVCPTCKVPLR